MSYLKNRVNAFGYAFSGLKASFSQETHLKLHAIIAALVIGFAAFIDVSVTDWIVLLLSISLVIAFEMLNSAIEKLCDLVMPGQHPKIKYIKDVSAGAVLVACVFSVVAGLIVFLPYIF